MRAAPSPDVVISQVYGGGGNSGAFYANDFIELYNRGGTTVDLTGWSVQYAAAGGTTWSATALHGQIPPGQYYLVQQAPGTGGGTPLPPPDATGSTNVGSTQGKVALVTTASALACGADCDTATGVRDFVGYGGANDFETAPTRNTHEQPRRPSATVAAPSTPTTTPPTSRSARRLLEIAAAHAP